VFVDSDDPFLDVGVHVVVFSLVDKEYLVCSEHLRWGVITFRRRRLFMDRSMVNRVSHDLRVKSL
jgi:hypothetical protein